MKKSIHLFFALVLCLSLCACNHEHAYGEWTTISEVTCITAGTKERVCECGEKEIATIAAPNHTYVTEQLVEVTCTESGQVQKTCSVCGDLQTELQPASGHTFQAATAFYPKTCSACGTTEGDPLATVVAIGDIIESEKHVFTIESWEFGDELLREDIDKCSYYYFIGGGPTFVIKLTVTNLATTPLDSQDTTRINNIRMEYMSEHQYEGNIWIHDDNIVPLDYGRLRIVFNVPESMKDDTANSILVSFTFDGEPYAMIIQQGNCATTEDASHPSNT